MAAIMSGVTPRASALSGHLPNARSSWTPAGSAAITAVIRSLYFGPGCAGIRSTAGGRSTTRAGIGVRGASGAGDDRAATFTGAAAGVGDGSAGTACFGGSGTTAGLGDGAGAEAAT